MTKQQKQTHSTMLKQKECSVIREYYMRHANQEKHY